jgi:hypothetical protein
VDSVAALVRGALRLEPEAFGAVLARPDGLRVAVVLLGLAGLSHVLGQSVVLFAHRVRPWRFAVSLLLGAALFAASVVAWGVALYLAGRFGFGRTASLGEVVRVVGLAHAPRLLGILVLTPYFGSAMAAGLTVWTLLALTVGARAAFGVELVEALWLLGAAWLVSEVLGRTVGRPVTALVARIRRWVAGTVDGDPPRRASGSTGSDR